MTRQSIYYYISPEISDLFLISRNSHLLHAHFYYVLAGMTLLLNTQKVFVDTSLYNVTFSCSIQNKNITY